MNTTEMQGQDHVVFDAEPVMAPTGECAEPVGNTTFVFDLVFQHDIDSIRDEDAVDQEIIDSRRAEPTESMDAVFARLRL